MPEISSSLVRVSRDSSTESEAENEEYRNKRRKISAQLNQLCTECENLDLDQDLEDSAETYRKVKDKKIKLPKGLFKASDGRHYYNDAISVHHFKDRLSRPSNCPLCTFFRSMRVLPDGYKRHKLLAFRSSESWMFGLKDLKHSGVWGDIKDTVFMAVVPDDDVIPPFGHEEHWMEKDIPETGTIYRLKLDESREPDPDILLRARELTPEANISLVQKWLGICRQHHGKSCGRREAGEPIERGFRLIDCNSDDLVVEDKPWGTPYAALSYVWGSSPADKEDWPKTVVDAMAVTKQLGLQYLWVDRRCINQSDDDEKAYLISRMTTIYEEADFTIVAAAGSGASYGLPGVKSTPRKPQPKYYLNSGSLLLSTLPDPRRDVFKSDYWTRGWTYQEGVLSKRRITFTDHQIYWECQGMAMNESIDIPLFPTPSTDDNDIETRMADFMLTGIFKGDAYSGGISSNEDDLVITEDQDYRIDYGFPMPLEATTRAQLRGLNEHIRAFSKRKLTFGTDVLPAFQGILGLYKQSQQLHLLNGIPMWIGSICKYGVGAQLSLALSLTSWYHRTGESHQMFVSEPWQRRDHLPSWTWAGWNGPVTWRAPPNYEHGAFMSDLIACEDMRLLWAEDIFISNPSHREPIRLLSIHSKDRLEHENLTLLEIKDPLVLRYFARKQDTKKQWSWSRMAGRSGRTRHRAATQDWDMKWHRIAGRLSFIALSVAMTEGEWTKKHFSEELISVLIFASRDPTTEHGRARFLTLRKVAGGTGRWERIGMLSLIIPGVSLAKCKTNRDFLKQIPAHRREGVIVIQ